MEKFISLWFSYKSILLRTLRELIVGTFMIFPATSKMYFSVEETERTDGNRRRRKSNEFGYFTLSFKAT
jgi:hypothetical protein